MPTLFLLVKFDELSDKVCPSQPEQQDELSACYERITENLMLQDLTKNNAKKLSKLQTYEPLNYSDYCILVLAKNFLPMNHFKNEFCNQIWRTLESVLMDHDDPAFKLEIVSLFMPETKNRFWPAGVQYLEKILIAENSKLSAEEISKINQIYAQMLESWSELPCFELIFDQTFAKLDQIKEKKLLSEEILTQLADIKNSAKKLKRVKISKIGKDSDPTIDPNKPKTNQHSSIMMFEPKLDKKLVDPLHVKLQDQTPAQKSKALKNRLKNERRNAEKELKGDAEFVNKVKLNKQMGLDKKRKEAVKRLLGQLGDQEGEARKIKKTKYKLFQ